MYLASERSTAKINNARYEGGGDDGDDDMARRSVGLAPECAALDEARLAASGLAEDGGAADAHDDRLRVREDRRDLVAAGALDVHEERVGVLHEALELVTLALLLGLGVKQIASKRHGGCLVCSKRRRKP